MAAFARTELDLVGLARQDNQAAVQLFAIRNGKLVGRDVFLLDAAREATDDEVLEGFLLQYYARATSIPREVYVPTDAARARRTSRPSCPNDGASGVRLHVPAARARSGS